MQTFVLTPEIMYDFTLISVGTHRQGDISRVSDGSHSGM